MIDNNEKVSVILPVYNAERYLERCLQSILNNTYDNLEIICVNDGSTDRSMDILRKFADTDKRLVLINKVNGGVSSARNVGMEQASGKYIAFIDADDWIHMQYFEILLKLIQHANADLVICRYIITDNFRKDKTIENQKVEETYNWLDFNSFFRDECAKNFSWGRLFRKEVIDTIRFAKKVPLYEDKIFNIELICQKPELKIIVTEHKLYYYFVNPNSSLHTLSAIYSLPAAKRFFYDAEETANSDEIKKIYLEEAIKSSLSARYFGMFSEQKGRIDKQCDLILKKSILHMWENRKIKFTQKLLFTFLARIPVLYRIFRIINDKTMLEWEKNQKSTIQ